MSKKNNYNSIVFLTTLSVYLGLVLVGATPSILAQAALTKDFDIKNEIVFEDDLDKKPDDEKVDFESSLKNYFDDVESFINALQNLRESKDFNPNTDEFEISSELFVGCNGSGDSVANSTVKSRKFGNAGLEFGVSVKTLIFEKWTFLSDCLQDKETENSFSTSSNLKLSYDNSELRIELSAPKLSKQRADFLAERFNQTYKIYKTDEEKTIVKTIYENTTFSSENNQVFIVTRLPRGSLDALLTTKDAQ